MKYKIHACYVKYKTIFKKFLPTSQEILD